jgi:hypothetical protein
MLPKENKEAMEVAYKFLRAQANGDYTTAKKYATNETADFLDVVSSLSQSIPDSVREAEIKATISIISENTEGNKCTVTYTISSNPQQQTVHLVKEKGKWLVIQSKDPQNEETDAAAQSQEMEMPAPARVESKERTESLKDSDFKPKTSTKTNSEIVLPYTEDLTPIQVAKKYLELTKNYEFDEAKKYATEELQSLIEMSKSFAELETEQEKELQRKSKDTNFKVVTETEEKCTIVYTNDKDGIKERKIDVLKVNGKWLVSMNKDPEN